MSEYTDEQTGMHLTVETEPPYDPDWPRITAAYAPKTRWLSDEEVTEAIGRLLRRAGYSEIIVAWVRVKHEP